MSSPKPILDTVSLQQLQENFYRPILDEDDYLCALLKYMEAGGIPEEDEQ